MASGLRHGYTLLKRLWQCHAAGVQEVEPFLFLDDFVLSGRFSNKAFAAVEPFVLEPF